MAAPLPETAPAPAGPPDAAAEAAAGAVPPATAPRSDYSLALSQYYQRLQNGLLAQGMLRGDGGSADTPFTDAMLARDFVRIALFDEYADSGSALVPDMRLARLRRWEVPVRMEVRFGPSIDPAQAERDRASVAAYAGRLAGATRHDIAMAGSAEAANFHVLFLNEDERLAIAPQLRELVPGIADHSVRAVQNLPRSTLCVVVAFSAPGSDAYTGAIAVIRGEHPDLLRLSCIHEELAQGLGLANDHPLARPSIFNDDQEFALLTGHDELLLRILYDARLHPGMNAAEAAPVVRAIATELMAPGV
ncbi:MAG: DUF2927 domain-containing protein [Rubellimicrobium sp.]|nr:DUF2927 domain-containing protein [Rubellimicrobium sp.]